MTTFDSVLLRDVSGTERIRPVFDSRTLVQSWLDVEAALGGGGGLEVDEARMTANLERTRAAILAESVMLALGRHRGRVRAHHLAVDVTRAAERRGVDFRAALRDKGVASPPGEDELERLLDAMSCLGEASELARAAAECAVAHREEAP